MIRRHVMPWIMEREAHQTMPRYVFGPFELNSEARLLRREGEPVPLAAKTLETLMVLVENRDGWWIKKSCHPGFGPDQLLRILLLHLGSGYSLAERLLGQEPLAWAI